MDQQKKGNLKNLLSSESVKTGHAIIRAIGGLTRYRIIILLNKSPDGLTVTELAKILGASSSQISHQVRILRKFDLVSDDPQGRTVTYRLNKELVKPFLG